MRNKSRAFTLIELLVVVLIIGILAAVALPQYQKSVVKSRLRTMQSLVEGVVKSQEITYLATGEYNQDPDTLLVSLPTPEKIYKGTLFFDLKYPWGECRVSYELIKCFDKNAEIGYGRYYQQVSNRNRKGKAECVALETNQEANQVCQADTGNATPFYNGTFGHFTSKDANSYSY